MHSDMVHDWTPLVFCIVFQFTILSIFFKSIFFYFLILPSAGIPIIVLGFLSQAKVCL